MMERAPAVIDTQFEQEQFDDQMSGKGVAVLRFLTGNDVLEPTDLIIRNPQEVAKLVEKFTATGRLPGKSVKEVINALVGGPIANTDDFLDIINDIRASIVGAEFQASLHFELTGRDVFEFYPPVSEIPVPRPERQPAGERSRSIADTPRTQHRVPLDDIDLEWQTDALCAQTDPEAFFPDKGGSTRDAKKVCASCEVTAQCLEYALANDERFGIWGGLSERERRKLKNRRL